MTKRYRGLQLIGIVLKAAGGLEIAFGVVSLVVIPLVLSGSDSALVQLGVAASTPGMGLGIGVAAGVFIFFIGVVAGLLTYALGELINVVIAIEENTRVTASNGKSNSA